MEKVTQILSSENLDVPKEEIVAEAALLWLNKCPTHRHTFEKVIIHTVYIGNYIQ